MSHERAIGQTPPREIYGVRLENPGIVEWKYRLFMDVAGPASLARRTSIEGSLPSVGPAIAVANHVSLLDPPLLYFVAGVTANRSLRMIARDTVVDPYMREDPQVLARTGKKEPPLFIRKAIAFCASIGDPIPVNRKGLGPTTIKAADETLRSGQILATSLTETRNPANDLDAALPLGSFFAYRHPDVPVFPVGVSGIEADWKHVFGPIIVKIGESFTVNGLGIDRTNRDGAIVEITEEIKRRIAPLVPDELKRTYMMRHTHG